MGAALNTRAESTIPRLPVVPFTIFSHVELACDLRQADRQNHLRTYGTVKPGGAPSTGGLPLSDLGG
jgi:hypothetical protein